MTHLLQHTPVIIFEDNYTGPSNKCEEADLITKTGKKIASVYIYDAEEEKPIMREE